MVRFGSKSLIVLALGLAGSLMAAEAAAQLARPQRVRDEFEIRGGFDIYGNARSRDPIRRPAGSFANPTQRLRTQDLQTPPRDLTRSPFFALPTDLRSRTPAAGLSGIRYPTQQTERSARLPRSTYEAYRQYGGFGDRTGYNRVELSSTLQRRYQILEATSLNAPVHRANYRNPSVAGLRATLDRTPTLREDVEDLPPLRDDFPSLDEKLLRGVESSREALREEAWALFRDRDYRRAARAFESATRLDSDDFEARVGEMFASLSVGGTVTSVAILAEIARRESNPFTRSVDITSRYATPTEAGRVRIFSQLAMEAAGSSAPLTALHAFVLWQLGDEQQALSTARSLADMPNSGIFREWPRRMRTVMELRGASGGPDAAAGG